MVDVTYPLRVLKHKFGNVATYHEGKTLLTAGVLGITIGVGGTYIALDEMEDNIQSDKAPQAMQRINNEMATLTEQKQKISNIKNEIDNLEFAPSTNKLQSLKEQERQAIAAFKGNAEDTLDYIITNKHLSEQQISELWHSFSDSLLPPEETGKYSNDYDFGFIKESRAEILSTTNVTPSISRLASSMNSQLTRYGEQKENSIAGLLGMAIVLPLMFFTGGSTARKWANEKPRRREKKPKVKSQFKH